MRAYHKLSKPDKVIFWKKQIKKWKSGNFNQKTYCEQNDLNFRTFQYWYYRLRKEDEMPNTTLVPIDIHPVKVTNSKESMIELYINQKLTIKIPPDFEVDALKKILTVLDIQK